MPVLGDVGRHVGVVADRVVETVIERTGGRALVERLIDAVPGRDEDQGLRDRGYQLALFEFAPIIARMLEAARPPDPGSRRLLHMSFANYAAGAIIMPYGKFLRAAAKARWSGR